MVEDFIGFSFCLNIFVFIGKIAIISADTLEKKNVISSGEKQKDYKQIFVGYLCFDKQITKLGMENSIQKSILNWNLNIVTI